VHTFVLSGTENVVSGKTAQIDNERWTKLQQREYISVRRWL